MSAVLKTSWVFTVRLPANWFTRMRKPNFVGDTQIRFDQICDGADERCPFGYRRTVCRSEPGRLQRRVSLRKGTQTVRQSIIEFPAVYDMLSIMKAKLDAGRALLYQTSRYVDIYKALDEHRP